MKQLAIMIVLTCIGTAGVVLNGPFYGIAVYYVFAVLRPQHLWEWALPAGVSWSMYVAVAAILGTAAAMAGVEPLLAAGRKAREASALIVGSFTTAHGLLLLTGAWFILSGLTADNTDVSYPWTLEYAKVFVMVAVAAAAIRSLQQAWIMASLAALSLGYIAYEINANYLLQGYLSIFRRGYGGLDNNGAGLMLAMGVPLCLFIWEGMRTPWRWVFLSLVPVLLHAVLMSYSRGAMLSLAVVAPLVVLRSRHRPLMTAGMVVMAFMLPFLAGEEIRARFTSIQEFESDGSAGSRLVSWQAGWDIARENPILGVGVRNSSLITEQYGVQEGNNRAIHSQYLQLAADSGLVGLALYLAALVAVWRSLRRTRLATREHRTDDERLACALANGIESSLAVFCIGAAFLSLEAFELPYLLLLLGAQLPVLLPAPATALQPAADRAQPLSTLEPGVAIAPRPLTARQRHLARHGGS
jgi:probable O-glycosylation ligase (exosortase A-associated)